MIDEGIEERASILNRIEEVTARLTVRNLPIEERTYLEIELAELNEIVKLLP